jgi:hypothetical protein
MLINDALLAGVKDEFVSIMLKNRVQRREAYKRKAMSEYERLVLGCTSQVGELMEMCLMNILESVGCSG